VVGMDSPGIESWWDEFFHICPNWPWGPPIFCTVCIGSPSQRYHIIISYHTITSYHHFIPYHHIIYHHIIPFMYFRLIHTGLQNPYGYGNSHIFGNQEVKPTQRCTTITWSSTMFEVSTQYELFNIITYNKIEACIRTFEGIY